MRIKTKDLGPGLHPSEVVVSVDAKGGPEALVIDRSALGADQSIEVGWPVAEDAGFALIELPQESLRGSWRVWVSTNDLLPSVERRRNVA